ncbi:hypothetical protein ACFV5N_14020 [Streptomyces sp. NPDC059853]|uniref:hypothetical protein n=1 Tax=Streptomyces sp. NPDC059853 TaxID=3346973 RepID=UPI003667EF6D
MEVERAGMTLDQHNTARDQGTVFAVQYGDLRTARDADGGGRHAAGTGPAERPEPS